MFAVSRVVLWCCSRPVSEQMKPKEEFVIRCLAKADRLKGRSRTPNDVNEVYIRLFNLNCELLRAAVVAVKGAPVDVLMQCQQDERCH